jgi:aminomethyltransferase
MADDIGTGTGTDDESGPGAPGPRPDRVRPLRSPLHDRHVAAGAKMADFGGWLMPIEFAGGGGVAEHGAVREQVGVFDVSHLGKALVRGPGAVELVNATLTNDLGRITAGQAQYTLCCAESGGVVDDLIVYRRADDDVLLVPNAANNAEVVRRLRDQAPPGVTVTDEHLTFGILAVQGRRSGEVLQALGLPNGHDYMSFVDAIWQGLPVSVCRTGYTGEIGYELITAWDQTGPLWDDLLRVLPDVGGRPAGLGARDTLRTEMGYPLHGNDLSRQITPVQARAGWAVGWAKPRFWGREALLAQKAAATSRQLRGLLALGRGVPRAGCQVRLPGPVGAGGPAGEVVGRTTSGTFSPTLRQGVALALLDRGTAVGSEVVVDVRGRDLPCRVVEPPFVEVRPAG